MGDFFVKLCFIMLMNLDEKRLTEPVSDWFSGCAPPAVAGATQETKPFKPTRIYKKFRYIKKAFDESLSFS